GRCLAASSDGSSARFITRSPGSGKSSSAMTLSVVVPVYNSSAWLKQCLAALARSQYDDFEALVVDDGSDEQIEPLVSSFGFKYLRIDGPGGPARARN